MGNFWKFYSQALSFLDKRARISCVGVKFCVIKRNWKAILFVKRYSGVNVALYCQKTIISQVFVSNFHERELIIHCVKIVQSDWLLGTLLDNKRSETSRFARVYKWTSTCKNCRNLRGFPTFFIGCNDLKHS